MTHVYRMLTVTAWGAEMSISKQAAYVAVKRCRIPVVDGLVDADAATLLYRNRTRYRVNTARMAKASRPAAAPMAAAGLADLAVDIARAMDAGDPRVFSDGMPHLLAVLGNLARLDEAAVQALVLPVRVADAVEAHLADEATT